jgi:RNA-splicing ligase RtcB
LYEVDGKYAKAIVFAHTVEPEAQAQILNLLNQAVFKDAKIRIMPDAHKGAGCVIGFTAYTDANFAIPNIVGVDLNCGMLSYCIGTKLPIALELFEKLIREVVPMGFSVHPKPVVGKEYYADTATITGQDVNYVGRSIGTLGGGNHFIEIGLAENDTIWITIHTGSRNFGKSIAEFYQAKAVEETGKMGGLEYVTGRNLSDYLQTVKVAHIWAAANRYTILTNILKTIGLDPVYDRIIESVHNYIEFFPNNPGYFMIRKGAIRANLEERVVIPWNMRDGLIIGRGKGNSDWNNSAPHGAGRVMSRGDAKRNLSLDKFKKDMEGIFTTSVDQSTIDESPDAYKDHKMISELIKPTVIKEFTIKPLCPIKAKGKENERA